jgi:transcriptional regulator with XRE-family HTH domain
VIMGDRLRALREQLKLSQGDIESRTGLLRCYVSRVENGHTVPSIETLEKLSRTLEIPLYQFLYDGEAPPTDPAVPAKASPRRELWGNSDRAVGRLRKLRISLSRLKDRDRKFLLSAAVYMARHNRRHKATE